jgi:hypothetical protein
VTVTQTVKIFAWIVQNSDLQSEDPTASRCQYPPEFQPASAGLMAFLLGVMR